MGKTIGERIEEMRIQAGAKNYKGHDYMNLNRFADDTRHMIIFDVVSGDSPWGSKGDRMRLYLNDIEERTVVLSTGSEDFPAIRI